MMMNGLGKTIIIGRNYWKRFGTALYICLAIIIIIAVAFSNGRKLLSETFQLDPIYLVLSILVEFSGLILAVPAWHLILAHLGADVKFKDNLRLYCYSMMGSVIPGSIWIFLGRVTLYDREGISTSQVVFATIIEMLLMGIAALLVVGLIGMFHTNTIIWYSPTVMIIATILAVVLIQPPVFNRLGMYALSRSRQWAKPIVKLQYFDLGKLFLLEVLTVIVGGSAVYYLLRSLIFITSELYPLVVGAWAAGIVTSNLLFWLPGKLVIRDGITILVLTQALTPSLAVTFVIIVRLWTVISILIAYLLAWVFLRPRSPQILAT